MENENVQFREYKGKALVRQGDSLCYGNMSDKHILSLMIMADKNVGGKEIPAKVEPRRAGDPSVLIASNKKAAAVLGWTPKRGLEEIIADAWAWHSSHPNGYED